MTETAPYAADSATSKAAAVAIQPSLNEIRQTVQCLIWGSPAGMTCDEFEACHDIPMNTARPRIWELLHGGVIVPSGEKRATRAGRMATVYVKAPDGHVYEPKMTIKDQLHAALNEVAELRQKNDTLSHRLQIAIARVQALLLKKVH